MRVDLIAVPYDSGAPRARMGAGPGRLLAGGLAERLVKDGHRVETTTITLPADAFVPEVQAAFELDRRLASSVASAVEKGAFPVVLAGNCISSVGTIAGLGEPNLGVMWFDAHGDFNTPETTIGGFLDGMALAVATGRCWTALAATVPGFQPVSERRVMMFGTRDLDPEEDAALSESDIERVSPDSVRTELHEVFARRRIDIRDVYLHIDLDVLDPSEGRANDFSAPDGMRLRELHDVVTEMAGAFLIRAAALTAFDPSQDTDGRMCETAIGLIATVVNVVSQSADTVS